MRFANLTPEQIKFIETVDIDKMFVTDEQAKEIRKVLDMAFKGETEIRAIRNSVVKHLSTKIEILIEKYEDTESALKLITNMSGITAVIDSVIWNMGWEV